MNSDLRKKQKFEADFESLYRFQCPDWFRDAKFGIWSHWGPQSVPMSSDWYARNMYIEGSPQYQHHLRTYGHPSQSGYIDICRSWKAERFDPDELMELYYRAGARYFMAQAVHHDNFFNYDSRINPFNSVRIGPGKDICRLWKNACEAYHMPFCISEHLAASFQWWYVNKGADSDGPWKGIPYDGNRPEYRTFYHSNEAVAEQMKQDGKFGELPPEWLTQDAAFQEYWKKAMYELIDLFEPDLLYSDSALPFHQDSGEGSNYQPGLDAVACLYNKSISRYGENRAVYTQKKQLDKKSDIYRIGILDIERSQTNEISEAPWQTDTCIGNWFYDAQAVYKKPGHIIEMLVDIISKNGCLMLNIPQKPDGTIDDEARFILKELEKWFSVCSEGVYGTRPFRTFAEGVTRITVNGFQEDRAPWTDSDYRFVRKGNTVYCFMMAAEPGGTAVIKTFTEREAVKSVRLLGEGTLPFSQNYGVLTVKLPSVLPTEYVNCLAVEM